MTWLRDADGYTVFFNRDEKRQRKPEVPPAPLRGGETRFLAPRDGDFGGTWIAVNEHGLTLCLLNGFPPPDVAATGRRGDYTTRGTIPMSLIELHSTPRVAELLPSLRLERFRPFILVALDTSGGLLADWSGRTLTTRDGDPQQQPLVSSSFYTEGVRRHRVELFQRLRRVHGPVREAHLLFHASHDPERGPFSPCMHRQDASTVSFTRIDVNPDAVELRYVPRSPCEGLPDAPALRLPRHQ